jgi:hypothetical protein
MNEDRATRYQRLWRRGRVGGLLTGVVALASAAFTPASRWVVDRASGAALPFGSATSA